MPEFVFGNESTSDFYYWVVQSYRSVFAQQINEAPGDPAGRVRQVLLDAAKVFVDSMLDDPDAPIASQLANGEVDKNEVGECLLDCLISQIDIEHIVSKILYGGE